MISNKIISDKANAKLNAGGLTDLELTQISSINNSYESAKRTVSLIADLPNVINNKGSLIFVEEDGFYYYSNGLEWTKDHDSSFSTLLIDVYSWGLNSSGQLGDVTTTSRSSPVTVVGGITNWNQVSAGAVHNLGLTATGIAYAWGSNANGRLGDNTTTNRSSPVTVVGGLTWSQVSAGNRHSLGVTSTGIAYAWGANGYGALGDGTTTERVSPVSVIGGITDWLQVSASGQQGRHSLGVTATGIAYAWGRNLSGVLGNGTTVSSSSPVTVIGGITNWIQVSACGQNSLGVTSTGIAYAWGANGLGQLGDNTTTNRSSPVTVVGGITNWSQVASGSDHSLGLTATGIAYAWGSNANGKLGDGTTVSKSSPVTVVGGITNWTQVSGGDSHSLGINVITKGF
jgi:alpha-tubulin suppressor-like RCC1 family protein